MEKNRPANTIELDIGTPVMFEDTICYIHKLNEDGTFDVFNTALNRHQRDVPKSQLGNINVGNPCVSDHEANVTSFSKPEGHQTFETLKNREEETILKAIAQIQEQAEQTLYVDPKSLN